MRESFDWRLLSGIDASAVRRRTERNEERAYPSPADVLLPIGLLLLLVLAIGVAADLLTVVPGS
jgi:hypothetical protein